MDERTKALKMLKNNSGLISRHQIKTIRGQILSGNISDAMRGISRIANSRNVQCASLEGKHEGKRVEG